MNFKLILVVFCTAISTLAYAQIELETDGEKQILGPKAGDTRIGLSVSSIDFTDGSYKDVFSLEIEHFFKDKWSVAAILNGHILNRETANYRTSNWGIGMDLATRYYFLKKKRWNLWAEAKTGFTHFNIYNEDFNSDPVYESTSDVLRAALGIGVEYKTSDRFSIFLSSDLIGSSHVWENGKTNHYISTLRALSLGVKFKL